MTKHRKPLQAAIRSIVSIAAALIFAAGICLTAQAPAPNTFSAADKSDMKAVLAGVKCGVPTQLDMSNPVQYRFFMRQLQAAGLTEARYPALFAMTSAARRRHPLPVERRSIRELAALLRANAANPNAVQPIQTFTALGTKDGTNYSVEALSSVASTAHFSILEVGVYDTNQNPLGPIAVVSSATSPETDLDTVANGVSATRYGAVEGVAVYAWQDQYGHAYHGVLTAIVTSAPTNITNTNPAPLSGQTVTKLCLGRTGADCTYTPAGGSGSNVIMPVTGSITFAQNISTTPPTPNTAQITMARPDTGQGQGCTIDSTSDFFGDPNTRITGGTINWNLQPAQFQPANGCLIANSTAIYTFTVGLTVGNLPVFVTITSDPNTDPTDPYFKKITELQVFFSCVAEGTRVRLENGERIPIEQLSSGSSVMTNADGHSDKVLSKLKGREEVPMIRLTTSTGRTLLITDGHPVITPRGPVLARDLRAGDGVITEAGVEVLKSVTREMFGGAVWNLNVGQPPRNIDDPSAAGRTFFADGFLIGDNVMQFIQNRNRQRADALAALPPPPKEWARDIQSAIEDQKK